MKILLCTNSLENVTNGPAKFANLVLDINKQYTEHEIHILTEDVSYPTEYVHSIKIRLPFFLKPASQFLRMYLYHRAAQKLHKKHSYDVLLYNNAFIGLWSAWFSKIPTVGMINDDNNLETRWNNFKPTQRWIKQFLFKQFEYLSVRSHQLIITNSNFLSQKVKAEYGHETENPQTIQAVDISKITFNSNRSFGKPVQILFVKTDYTRGNLAFLIKALNYLATYSFVVTVVGPDEHFKPSIQALFTSSHVSLNWKGIQTPAQVNELMQQQDIFCVPARQEALGVANIEALAHGISVVSTFAGGIPEVLNYGENGWLVDSDNVPALASAIEECIRNKDLRQKKSEQGRLFAERFNKDTMLANLLKILHEICT